MEGWGGGEGSGTEKSKLTNRFLELFNSQQNSDRINSFGLVFTKTGSFNSGTGESVTIFTL